jgi:hypothetical protein
MSILRTAEPEFTLDLFCSNWIAKRDAQKAECADRTGPDEANHIIEVISPIPPRGKRVAG